MKALSTYKKKSVLARTKSTRFDAETLELWDFVKGHVKDCDLSEEIRDAVKARLLQIVEKYKSSH